MTVPRWMALSSSVRPILLPVFVSGDHIAVCLILYTCQQWLWLKWPNPLIRKGVRILLATKCFDGSFGRVQYKLQEVKASLVPSHTVFGYNTWRWLIYFIKAERTGNWYLHLQSLKDLVPYFAAAGHNMYNKSCIFICNKLFSLKHTNQMFLRCSNQATMLFIGVTVTGLDYQN